MTQADPLVVRVGTKELVSWQAAWGGSCDLHISCLAQSVHISGRPPYTAPKPLRDDLDTHVGVSALLQG